MTSSSKRLSTTFYLLIFLAALAVRMIHLAVFHDSAFAESLLVDARWHDDWAWGWAQKGIAMDGTALFRAPLYPLWLTGLYKLFGHELLVVRIAQILLGASVAPALAGTVTGLWGNRSGTVAGVLAVFYGPFVYFEQELLIPALLLPLLAWAVYFLVSGLSLRHVGAAGVLLGLAVIARPNTLVLLPLFAWFVWRRARHAPPRLLATAILFSTALLPAHIVTYLNYRAEGVPVFIASQGGINFYAGNNPTASGRSADVPEFATQIDWREFVPAASALAQEESGRDLNSAEISRFWMNRGIGWLRENPVSAIELYGKKAYYLFAAHEIPNNRNLYFQTPWPLRALLWETRFFSFPAGLIFPLAVVGMVLGLTNPLQRRGTLFLTGWVLLYACSLLPFFVCARFRLPLILPLLGLAALTLVRWRELLRPRLLVLFLAALVFVNGGFFGTRRASGAADLTKFGAALLETGETPRAVSALEEAHRLAPTDLGAAFWLAVAYSRSGAPEKALPLYAGVAEIRQNDPELWYLVGTTHLETGDAAGAVEPLEQAALLAPDDFRVWVNLAAAFETAGRLDEAVESYRRAIREKPSHELAHIRLAALYLDLNRVEDAIKTARGALDLNPQNEAVRTFLEQLGAAPDR